MLSTTLLASGRILGDSDTDAPGARTAGSPAGAFVAGVVTADAALAAGAA